MSHAPRPSQVDGPSTRPPPRSAPATSLAGACCGVALSARRPPPAARACSVHLSYPLHLIRPLFARAPSHACSESDGSRTKGHRSRRPTVRAVQARAGHSCTPQLPQASLAGTAPSAHHPGSPQLHGLLLALAQIIADRAHMKRRPPPSSKGKFVAPRAASNGGARMSSRDTPPASELAPILRNSLVSVALGAWR